MRRLGWPRRPGEDLMRSSLLLLLALALASYASACSCESPRIGNRRDTGVRDGGPDQDTNVPPGTDTGIPPVDANRPDTGFMMCDGLDFDAEMGNRPIDIVWVIDNSGSMGEEAALV